MLEIIHTYICILDLWSQCINHKVSESKIIFGIACGYHIASFEWFGIATWGETLLFKNFRVKYMGEVSYVINIRIHKDRSQGILGLLQETYINKILGQFKRSNVHLMWDQLWKGTN